MSSASLWRSITVRKLKVYVIGHVCFFDNWQPLVFLKQCFQFFMERDKGFFLALFCFPHPLIVKYCLFITELALFLAVRSLLRGTVHIRIVMPSLCVTGCVFYQMSLFLNSADMVSLYGCMLGNIFLELFCGWKEEKLGGGLQALKDLRRVKWKSLLQVVEKVFSERLQSEQPDIHSSSLGNFMAHSWSIAWGVQSAPTKPWPHFV